MKMCLALVFSIVSRLFRIAGAAVAQSVKRPELRSLKEVTDASSTPGCGRGVREKILAVPFVGV